MDSLRPIQKKLIVQFYIGLFSGLNDCHIWIFSTSFIQRLQSKAVCLTHHRPEQGQIEIICPGSGNLALCVFRGVPPPTPVSGAAVFGLGPIAHAIPTQTPHPISHTKVNSKCHQHYQSGESLHFHFLRNPRTSSTLSAVTLGVPPSRDRLPLNSLFYCRLPTVRAFRTSITLSC